MEKLWQSGREGALEEIEVPRPPKDERGAVRQTGAAEQALEKRKDGRRLGGELDRGNKKQKHRE